MSQPFSLTILGTSAAVPTATRWLAGQVLNVQDELYLIDCGEGTQFRMAEFGVKKSRINHIFISHLHGDHFFGLPGLLTSMAMAGRTDPLSIFSPKGLSDIISTLFKNSYYQSPFPIHFFEVNTEGVSQIVDNQQVSVYSFPLSHRIPTVGFIFREKEKPRNILPEKIDAYKIPFAAIRGIKNGADFLFKNEETGENGFLIPNAELTTPPPKPRSYAYCSDTIYLETNLPHIAGVDLLYHEATFLHEMAAHAHESGHSTAFQAGEMAKKAAVGRLIIGHFSSRYDDIAVLEAEARTVFPTTFAAFDGAVYDVALEKIWEKR